MKTWMLCMALGVVLAVPGLAAAQEFNQKTIATADLTRIANEYTKLTDDRNKLRDQAAAEGAPFRAEFEAWQKRAERFRQSVERDEGYLESPEGIEERQQLSAEESRLRSQIPDFSIYQEKEERIIQESIRAIEAAIRKVAEKRGILLVLDATESAVPGGTIYHRGTTDITDEVLKELNGGR